MKLARCDFCYGLYKPPNYFRAPSGACDRCWLVIACRIASQPEPDFDAEHKARINFDAGKGMQ